MRLALFALALGASIALADDGRGIDAGFDETKAFVWLDDGHASWNAYAGDLQELRDTGIYTQVEGPLVDRSCDLDVPRFRYDTTPEPGHCAFLLVSGNGAAEGGLGTDSSGGIRPNTRSCHPELTLPEPAGTPSAVPGHCRGLVITWPASPSDDVTIYRLSAGTVPGTPVYVWPVSATVTYIDGLSDATTYYLSVVAVDAAGNESAPTAEIEATTANTTSPQAPTDLIISEGGPGIVNALAWPPVEINVAPLPGDPASPAIRDLAGYRVYRSAGGDLPLDDAHRIADLDAASLGTGDLVRACSHSFYTVTAMDTCGLESAPSPKVEVVAAPGREPKPPENVHVSQIGATNVVSWSPSTTDVQGQPIATPIYVVERAGPAGTSPDDGGFHEIGVLDGTLQMVDGTFPSTQPDEKLYYRVRAEDDCPTPSAPSAAVGAACPFPGEVTITPPADGSVAGGVTPVTVWVSSGATTHLEITYTHATQGVTRVFETRTGGSSSWTDAGWLAAPVGDYVITAKVTAANGCAAEKSIRVHAGRSTNDTARPSISPACTSGESSKVFPPPSRRRRPRPGRRRGDAAPRSG